MSETPGLFPLPMHTAQLNFPGSFHVVGVLRWVPANGMRQKCQFLASTVHPQHAYTFSKHAFQKRLVWPCDHMLRTAIYHMDKSGSLRDSGTHTAKSHTTSQLELCCRMNEEAATDSLWDICCSSQHGPFLAETCHLNTKSTCAAVSCLHRPQTRLSLKLLWLAEEERGEIHECKSKFQLSHLTSIQPPC